MCISRSFFQHCKIDEILTKVSFCMFKKVYFLTLSEAPTGAIPCLVSLNAYMICQSEITLHLP